MANEKTTFDAIVIGSGISGGWAAKELTEKGLRVLLLERGKPLEHITGYAPYQKDPWEFPLRGRLTQEQIATHPYLSRKYPYTEHNEGYWFKDTDAPYTEVNRFDWFRSDIVGGRSIMWGRQSYRHSPLDFEANARDGAAPPWPIGYADLAPWYDYVERFAGISGENLGLAHFPDQQLLPTMPLNAAELYFREKLSKSHPERYVTMGRVANLTQPHQGRNSCQYRNLCSRGCPFSAYFSTQSTTLPAAMATKRLTLRPHSIVNSILYDAKRNRASGVLVIDSLTGAQHRFRAKVIFVCASAIASAWILLNSRSPQFPHGLGNNYDVVGRYVMDHHSQAGATGVLEDALADRYYAGRRPNGIYIPRFRNIGDDRRDYLRGFGYQGGAGRQGWQRTVAQAGFGEALKAQAAEPGLWAMSLAGFAETLPYADNRMWLNDDLKDKWGQPTITFDCTFRDNERRMRVDMVNDAAEMLETAGFRQIETFNRESPFGSTIHEMGTARMGNDPHTAVLNAWNQLHDCRNVFVTDGAAMASASNVNPSLTYMALTARAADYAVRALRRRDF